jgi:DNA-binding cell septation regulator SpoVG
MPTESSIAHQHNPPSKIRILTIKQAAGGNVRAFVDIQLGTTVVVHGFRIIQQPGQKPWVSPPQREWTGDDGKRHYAPVVELSGDLKRQVEQAILAAWEGGRHE